MGSDRTTGSSLVEMLIATLVLAMVSVAIFSMLTAVMTTGGKLNNKLDVLDECRDSIDKIGRDTRQARNFGDVYGNTVTFVVNGKQETIVEGSQIFPSNTNPLYGRGQAPPDGWPWGLPSYDMNGPERGRLLVIQVPIFDALGFPTAIPPNTGTPASPRPQDNVETHLYRVVQDPENPGEWLLQWCKVPGMAVTGYTPGSVRPSRPQTLLKGIIGPLINGQPRTFQFLNRFDSRTHDTIDDPPPQQIASYTGVVLNFEIRQHQHTSMVQGQFKSPGTLAFKTEVFVRNNASATTVGMPSTAR